jgi:hypothetical protein
MIATAACPSVTAPFCPIICNGLVKAFKAALKKSAFLFAGIYAWGGGGRDVGAFPGARY